MSAPDEEPTDWFLDEAETHTEYEAPRPFRVQAGLPVPSTTRGHATTRGQLLAGPFMLSWKAMREILFMQQRVPYLKLPKYVEKYLRLLWDTSEGAALRAMAIGDVPFFIGWLFRLDAIDVAMIDKGYSLADRAPLIRFRAVTDGYREVAEKRLKKLGGRWPPVAEKERAAAKRRR